MMDDITTLTIDKLRLSPLNLRRKQKDTAPLEASILASGQLNPILCHPMRGSKGLYGAHAGGTRYRALRALVERGALPADHPVYVRIREGFTDLELEEDSLAENFERNDLDHDETYAGVLRLHRHGRSPAEIAERFGVKLHWVEGAIRLGDLAQPIFAAFAAGRISLNQAMAFGATADKDLQLAVWKELSREDGTLPHAHGAIRKALRFGDATLDRLLRFVGEKAYLAEGGRIEPDLFAEPEDPQQRIADDMLLRNLAERLLSKERKAIRSRFARPELRFEAEPPRGEYQSVDHKLQITPGRDGDRDTLPDGNIFARLYVDQNGKAEVDFWWASRSAKAAGGRQPLGGSQLLARMAPRSTDAAEKAMDLRPAAALGQQYDNARQVADAAIREDEGLSADSVQIFRSVRRQILRGMLVDAAERGGDIAHDYLIWTQLRLMLDPDARPSKLGVGHSAKADSNPAVADDHVSAMPATIVWKRALGELMRQSFLTAEDLGEAFSDYVARDDRTKRLAAAVVAGFALERSLAAEGYVVPVHDRLARHLGVMPQWHDEEVRRYWTPTEALLAKVPTRQALAIAEPFIEPEPFGAWMKAKAADVTRRLVQLVTGNAVPGQRADRAGAAARWVHPLLRFAPDPGFYDNGSPSAPAPAKEVA